MNCIDFLIVLKSHFLKFAKNKINKIPVFAADNALVASWSLFLFLFILI
jgi:hypothetical protein